MDPWSRAVLTACGVALVMAVGQRLGPRAAGVVTGLPVVTAPAMAWLAHDAGADFAAGSAVAGVAAGAMLAAFALIYVRVAGRAGVLAAVAAGLAGACALALPTLIASRQWSTAMALSLASCAAALRALPKRRCTGVDRPVPAVAPRRSTAVLTASAAAGLSVLASAIGPWCGVFLAGMVTSLPVVGASVAVAEHAAGGHAAVAEFLRGYVLGLFGRTAFGTVFALAVLPLGTPYAVLLACAAALAVAGLVTAARSWRLPACRGYHRWHGASHIVDRASPRW